MLTFIDNFGRTSTDTLGDNWTALQSTISGWGCNGSEATRTAINAIVSVYFNKSLAAKAYTEFKVVDNTGAATGVIARAQVSGTIKFYMVYATAPGASTAFYIFYFDGSTYNSLGSKANVGFSANDTMAIDCSGSTITAYKNGSTIGLSATDTNLTSGYSGMFRDTSNGLGTAKFDDFTFKNYDPPVLKPLIVRQAVNRAATY